MEPIELFGRLGVGLGAGLLVGLQREVAGRERHDAYYAGARTFAFLGMAGGVAAYLSDRFGSAVNSLAKDGIVRAAAAPLLKRIVTPTVLIMVVVMLLAVLVT